MTGTGEERGSDIGKRGEKLASFREEYYYLDLQSQIVKGDYGIRSKNGAKRMRRGIE